ncbi:SAM-dependent methyltransferase [Pseudonocardia sp. HH130630-07]|uniref:SAM-dependent methyltransferase n=1 Tax=Pseudonocardia sp. HH130630-07 TaxID=1690815 RepID=UPI0018D3AF49|nr:SAM-dependent methyltransferase [Pseudonocardia sp. HH130630-07]
MTEHRDPATVPTSHPGTVPPASRTVPVPAGVGATALFIAALRAEESARPDSLFGRDPLAELVAAGIDGDALRLWRDDDGAPSPLGRALAGYVAMRTRYFDDYLAGAVGAGVRQVVVLGAGVDGRAYRLALPGATLFEIDTADVTGYRCDLVAAGGLTPTTPARPVVADLADDGWPEALLGAGFDPAAPTAWLAEGLLLYLPGEACAALLDTVGRLSAAGSELATEYPQGDLAAVIAGIDSGPAVTSLIRGFLAAGPQLPPEQWLGRAGWSVDATGIAAWATGLDRTPPSWSLVPDFTWWLTRAATGRR